MPVSLYVPVVAIVASLTQPCFLALIGLARALREASAVASVLLVSTLLCDNEVSHSSITTL